jgi:transposase-like protein
MPEQRRKFSPQFKAEAVQMVIETGTPVAEVARDLGLNDGTLGNWVKACWMSILSRTSRCRPSSRPA